MSEAEMVGLVDRALERWGIDDRVAVAGQFAPRGHTGGAFIGGLAGAEAGDALGGVGGSLGMAAGLLGGQRAADDAAGLPASILVGVSPSTVYGLAAPHRSSEPTALLFSIPRHDLQVHVHQRVNVRILELVHEASGSRVELEGNRIPLTHSKDVIEALTRRA